MLPYNLTFRHTPAILSRMVASIPAERHAEPVEGRFSLLEMVGHLADYEAVFLGRMRAAIEQDVPEFGNTDISQRALDEDYAGKDMAEQLESFTARRRETLAFLEGLSEAQLAREFVQSFGRMSVRDFVALFAGHDLYHLEQASEYLGS